MNGEPQQIQLKASDQDLKGVYSNLMQVTHTKEEFILDFFSLNPSMPVGVLASRVILSPSHLKRMAAVLEDNMKKYESKFGKVSPAEESDKEIGFKA